MATPTATMAALLVGQVLATVGGVAVPVEDQVAIIAVKNFTDIARYPKDKFCVEITGGKEYSVRLDEDITTTAP